MDAYAEIAAYYDGEHQNYRDEFQFYVNLVASGPVLEVGAGTGLLLRALTDAGIEVWGVDVSDAMLRRARERVPHLDSERLIRTSILDLSLDTRFAYVIFPLNVLWHLDELHEQAAALTVARRHLRSEGAIIVALSNPLTLADRGAAGELRERTRWTSDNGLVIVYSAGWDDEARQKLRLHLTYEETSRDAAVTRRHAELSFRYVYRAELELMLLAAGFPRTTIYGSFDLDDYSQHSPNLIAVSSLPRQAGD